MKVPEQPNIAILGKETLISTRLTKKERKNHQVRTTSIPTDHFMSTQRIAKQLWIGLVEVRALTRSKVLGDAKGAFVNLVTWATDAVQFKSNAEVVLGKLGLFVVDIENPEPVSTRRRSVDIEEEIEDMIARAENNPNAIIYGTFHTWKRDTA